MKIIYRDYVSQENIRVQTLERKDVIILPKDSIVRLNDIVYWISHYDMTIQPENTWTQDEIVITR
jgi:NaMN:DMB phosphoribosyltransferase